MGGKVVRTERRNYTSLTVYLICVREQVTIVLYIFSKFDAYWLWQYGLWSFQTGGTKLEKILPKNQHTQRKFLNFENWTNGEPQ